MALTAGQTVIVDRSRYGTENLSIERIDRVTPTQIIIRHLREGMAPSDERFYRDGGSQVGGDQWSREWLRIPTPELLARVEKAKLVARFTSLKWKDLHLDTLRGVNAAIKSNTSATSAGLNGTE